MKKQIWFKTIGKSYWIHIGFAFLWNCTASKHEWNENWFSHHRRIKKEKHDDYVDWVNVFTEWSSIISNSIVLYVRLSDFGILSSAGQAQTIAIVWSKLRFQTPSEEKKPTLPHTSIAYGLVYMYYNQWNGCMVDKKCRKKEMLIRCNTIDLVCPLHSTSLSLFQHPPIHAKHNSKIQTV